MWEFLLEGYNRKMNTNHKTTKQMLTELYRNQGNLQKSADFLGVSVSALYQQAVRDRIPRRTYKGNAFKGIRKQKKTLRQQFALFPEDKIKNMSAREISKATGKGIAYVRKFLRKNKIEHKTFPQSSESVS